MRMLHYNSTFCGPKCECCAQTFDLKSFAPILNQLVSDFLFHFSSQGFGGFSSQQHIKH